MWLTGAAGWKLKGMLSLVAALTFARLRLATPPAVVNVPPSRTDPSVPQTTVLTTPFTLGSNRVILYGAVAEKAKALLRGTSSVELGFFTCENLPTAYMVLPHWTICRTSSTDPSPGFRSAAWAAVSRTPTHFPRPATGRQIRQRAPPSPRWGSVS